MMVGHEWIPENFHLRLQADSGLFSFHPHMLEQALLSGHLL